MTRPTTIEQGIAEAARKARRSCLPPSILFLRANGLVFTKIGGGQ
jgi:hypothetical protein